MHEVGERRRPSLLRRDGAGRTATLLAVALMAVGCGTSAPALHASGDPTHPRSAAPSSTRDEPTPELTTGRSAPVTLSIPAIGLRSRLMRLRLEPDGSLEVPPGAFPAGWFAGAPTPGEMGPAVIAGHVHWIDSPGVFRRLGELRRADHVSLTRRDGSIVTFRVTGTETFVKDRFPTRRVYGDIDHAGLRLITCGGYDKVSESYESNVVVFAELVAVRDG